MHRWRNAAILFAFLAVLALALPLGASRAGDLVDLTLTFEGAVHGEVAPCG